MATCFSLSFLINLRLCAATKLPVIVPVKLSTGFDVSPSPGALLVTGGGAGLGGFAGGVLPIGELLGDGAFETGAAALFGDGLFGTPVGGRGAAAALDTEDAALPFAGALGARGATLPVAVLPISRDIVLSSRNTSCVAFFAQGSKTLLIVL